MFFFAILIGVFLGIGKFRLKQKELVPESSDVLQYVDEKLDVEREADNINVIYGSYKITNFLPTQYYKNMKYDVMPEQEADMLLGRIVVIRPEILITYDTERSLGTRSGREAFDGNYMIETYRIEDPQYDWNMLETDVLTKYPQPDWEMEQAIGKGYLEQLEAVISTPQLCSEPYGIQYFYTLNDKDKLIMYSGFTNQYFLLERCIDEPEEELQELTDSEKEELLKEVYGEYRVMEFLPTKYYPVLDSNGDEYLPEEEADMMIGQKILIGENCFLTYDNYRRPNSYITERSEEDFQLEKVEVENPRYQVKSVRREEIYGIRDGILIEEVELQIYVEIDVYPGYETNGSKTLPQLFLIEDGRIALYSMGEYFLLEKTEDNLEENKSTYSTERLLTDLAERVESNTNQVDEEDETENQESQVAAICESVRAMEFTVNEPHMDVSPEENTKYLEAYLKVLKNEMPVYGGVYTRVQEEYYYEDLWRAGIEFETLLEEKDKREFQY